MSSPHCERIGHGGASAIAPANTIGSFDAALAVGIDMIEFDLRAWGGELVLAHTKLHARHGARLPLHRALAHLSSRRFREVGVNVDVKHLGCEGALLDGLRRAGLLERTLISSQVATVLDGVRALEPRARVGISIGGWVARCSQRWGGWREHVLAGLAMRRWDALMAQHRLVDAGLLEDVASRRGRLYAWTVNERPAIDHLRALGVDGIVTSDPRLFA